MYPIRFTTISISPSFVVFLASLWSMGGVIGGYSPAAIAQISADGSLSTTVTSPDQLNFQIEGGDRAGNNLFHSFDQFSVPTNGSAQFNNDVTIDTIFNRVTGDSLSSIDGLFQTNGTPDVFLINPNGFVFGPNARLNVGGSFIATTADSLVFSDGVKFDVTDSTNSPLLSISTPMGLQMGHDPGAIILVGTGHQLTQDNDFAPILSAGINIGLQTLPGQTLGFIGGDIQADGAVLLAPGGHIELGSGQNGFVGLARQAGDGAVAVSEIPNTAPSIWQFSYDNVDLSGAIQLSQRSLLDVSSLRAGSITLQGDRIHLTNGSILLSQNLGAIASGDITVHANTRFMLAGTTVDRFRSSIQSNAFGTAPGSGINIQTSALRLQDRGAIVAFTFGPGPSGNVNITASNRVDIRGGEADISAGDITNTLIGANAIDSIGNAGNIRIQTQQLNIQDGGLISTSNILGNGNGGNITISADVITLTSMAIDQLNPPGITAATLGDGNAGNVIVNTRTLSIQDGNLVDSSSLAAGDAGNVTVRASEQILIGDNHQSHNNANVRSLISSTVVFLSDKVRPIVEDLLGEELQPSGAAGRIRISTPYLQLNRNGVVAMRAEGEGTAGRLDIRANVIELINGGAILATNDTRRSGDIRLHANTLRLDNGLINASTLQSGRGGDIVIRATEAVDITGQGATALGRDIIIPAFEGRFESDNVTQGIAAIALEAGQAGAIDIQTGNLNLRQGSAIATVAFNDSRGGDIRIRSDNQVSLDESVITSSTFGSGPAGDMTIRTDQLWLQHGSQLVSATFGVGQAGNLWVQALEQTLLENSITLAGQTFASGLIAGTLNNAVGNGGDIHLTTPLLVIRDGAEVSVSALANLPAPRSTPTQNTAQAGNIHTSIGSLILDNGNITARSTQGKGGNIFLDIRNLLLLQNQSQISTQAGTDARGGRDGGNIRLQSPFIVARNNSDIVANAFEGNGGSIQIITQGLLGPKFREFLTPANDIASSSEFGISGVVTINTPEVDPASETATLPSMPNDGGAEIATGCGSTNGSQFIVTGRGGMPSSPTTYRPWNHIMEDLGPRQDRQPRWTLPPGAQSVGMDGVSRDFAQPHGLVVALPIDESANPSVAQGHSPADGPIQEATRIAIAPNGTVQLTAAIPRRSLSSYLMTCVR